VWGVRPLLLEEEMTEFEAVLRQAEECLLRRGLASVGDRILVIGGIPMQVTGGTNFLKIHTIGTFAAV
jgi:pyruvate kinase